MRCICCPLSNKRLWPPCNFHARAADADVVYSREINTDMLISKPEWLLALQLARGAESGAQPADGSQGAAGRRLCMMMALLCCMRCCLLAQQSCLSRQS